MPRDPRVYLADIEAACTAIAEAVSSLNFPGYCASRLVRSAVEREFIIIGEAVLRLSAVAPDLYARITRARRIIDFRNRLTHEYPTVDDELVWAIVERDVPVLACETKAPLEELEA